VPRFFDTDCRPIVISSHRRSGTHLTIDLIRRQFRECVSWKWPLRPNTALYWNLDLLLHDPGFRRRAVRGTRRPIIKTHLPIGDLLDGRMAGFDAIAAELGRWLGTCGTILHVVRDGRDVMASFHRYCKGFDPAARCSIGQFIRQDDDGLSRAARWARCVRGALDDPRIECIRYEDIVRRTDDVLRRLADLLELQPAWKLPRLPGKIRSRWQGRLHRLFRFRPPATTTLGTTEFPLEKWRTAFTPADREFFLQETGDLLCRLGYEDSDDWVRQSPGEKPSRDLAA